MIFEWPNDPMAYENISNNILLGRAVKVSMLNDKLNQDTTEYYFPHGRWCQMYPMLDKSDSNYCFDSPQPGLNKTLPS